MGLADSVGNPGSVRLLAGRDGRRVDPVSCRHYQARKPRGSGSGNRLFRSRGAATTARTAPGPDQSAMTVLVAAGLELVSVVVNMLSGKATKTARHGSASRPRRTRPTPPHQSAQNLKLPALAGSLTTVASAHGANDIASLVGAHHSVLTLHLACTRITSQFVVDNAGRNAIQWMSDWLNPQLGRAA